MDVKSQTDSVASEGKEVTAPKAASTKKHIPGLFERWMTLERDHGLTTGQILQALNLHAGTQYKHNWPSVMATRGYEMERIPVTVRRYMLRKVLENELRALGCELTQAQLTKLTIALT